MFLFNLVKKVKTRIRKNRGFTLLELGVVIIIFGIMTSIIFFNYGNFTSDIILTNVAYEIALEIREAQVFSLGVSGLIGAFDTPYGFYIPDIMNTTNKKFMLFNDKIPIGGDGQRESNGDEDVEVVVIPRDIVISDIKIDEGSGCVDLNPANELTVLFQRPNPEPVVSGSVNFSFVQITIQIPNNGHERYVIIRNTGQISVENIDEC